MYNVYIYFFCFNIVGLTKKYSASPEDEIYKLNKEELELKWLKIYSWHYTKISIIKKVKNRKEKQKTDHKPY